MTVDHYDRMPGRATLLVRAMDGILGTHRLTADNIRALITSLGDLHDVIRDATPAEKTAIYNQLDLKVTFKPGQAKIRAEITIGPDKYVEHAEQCGDTGRVRGGTDPIPPYCSICSSAELDL